MKAKVYKLPFFKNKHLLCSNFNNSALYDLLVLLAKLMVVVFALLIVFTFFLCAFRYGDISMIPKVNDGDLVVSNRFDKDYEAQDVIAFKVDDTMTCSRVIAIENDEVDIDSDGLKINGHHVTESNITVDTTQVSEGVGFPLTVPDNSVFVLGDNRTNAIDSRIYGCISKDQTVGKVIALFRYRQI